jgi:hypothetical protein
MEKLKLGRLFTVSAKELVRDFAYDCAILASLRDAARFGLSL